MPNTIENPFAIARPKHDPSRLLAAVKGLAMVAGLFAVLIVAQTQSRRWLLERWVTGLAELSVPEQIERLLQIDALGDIAIETVARRIAAKDDPVAATAFQLLQDHLNDWSSRDNVSMAKAHQNMIDGLEAVAADLSGERARWAAQLLQQSLVECVESDVLELNDAYQAATRVLAKLGSSSPGAASTATSIAGSTPPPPLPLTNQTAARPRLVPLSPRLQSVDDAIPITPTTNELAATQPESVSESVIEVINAAPSLAIATEPRITAVASDTSLQDIQPLAVSAHRANNEEIRDSITPVRRLTNSSLETFDTKSIINLLGHKQAEVRDHAVEELVRRGLSNEEIRIANQLASPVIEVRMGLLDSVVHRTDIDPRPWLLWLAEDSHREIRLRAITTLATMKDTAVNQALQKRLAHEHDSTVIAHLRRAIDLPVHK
jgi:hypothetical protein